MPPQLGCAGSARDRDAATASVMNQGGSSAPEGPASGCRTAGPTGGSVGALVIGHKPPRPRFRLSETGMISTHGLSETDDILDIIDADPGWWKSREAVESRHQMREFRERARHTVFTALCGWERQLTYANVNERIFERFRSRVDKLLAQGAPEVLDQFSAVYRRLREATQDPAAPLKEDLAQAVTTCRRILKAVADHLLPGVPGATTASGNALNDAAYRNRIYEFVKTNMESDATADTIKASVGGVYDRFSALDKLANKGVHAELGTHEAELCAISTYLVAGELRAVGSPSDGPGRSEPCNVVGRQPQSAIDARDAEPLAQLESINAGSDEAPHRLPIRHGF